VIAEAQAGTHGYAVIHQLSNRRLFQASARVLDAVIDELAEVRARTGDASTASDGWPALGLSEEFELGLRDVAVAAAYQASMRTASTVRQRSLNEFLR
jgi:hypothetical protein